MIYIDWYGVYKLVDQSDLIWLYVLYVYTLEKYYIFVLILYNIGHSIYETFYHRLVLFTILELDIYLVVLVYFVKYMLYINTGDSAILLKRTGTHAFYMTIVATIITYSIAIYSMRHFFEVGRLRMTR